VCDFNANSGAHYHLGGGELKRSTLSEANARRPVGVFVDLFGQLSAQLDRKTRRDGADLLRLIDSTPVPLPKFLDFARSNGRIHGMKMHVVHDPRADRPMRVEVTPANVNDIEIGKKTGIEAGATYVFDKGYCDYAWWTQMHAASAVFVTRPKTNARFAVIAARPLGSPFQVRAGGLRGDGFTVTQDCEVSCLVPAFSGAD
jgi:putative transposase